MIKKRFGLNKLKNESYRNVILNNNYIKSDEIFSIEMSINLNVAYDKYKIQSLC